jgi:hexokinase
MASSIEQFLQKYNFYSYLETSQFTEILDQQIRARLDLKNRLTIPFPHDFSHQKLAQQKAPFLVMDLGGTYLRIYLCQIVESQLEILGQDKISFYHKKTYTPEVLMEDLYNAIKKFLRKYKVEPDQLVFSFANALEPKLHGDQLDGKIIYWGKNHKQEGLLNLELAGLLENYLRQQGHQIDAQVINDGSISVLSAKFSAPEATIASIIVGTGTNINVGFRHQNKLYLANLEFGDFEFIPYSIFDEQLNIRVATPNHFRTEKLFSGAWDSLLFSIILEFAVKDELIKEAKNITKLGKLTSSDLEELFGSRKVESKNPQLAEYLKSLAPEDLKFCQKIWVALTKRGAAICAFALGRLAVILAELGYLQHQLVIAESGALLEHSLHFQEFFHEELTKTFEQLSLSQIACQTQLQSNTSVCQGAAVLINLLKSSA